MSGREPFTADDEIQQSGLSKRLGILLSVALLPLGLIALQQTFRLQEDYSAQAERALAATTLELADRERLTIRTAFGAAEALAVAAQQLVDPQACSDHMRAFVEASDGRFSFAGVIGADGRMTCSSVGRPYDFSGEESYATMAADPRPRVGVNRSGLLTGQHVIIATLPFGPDTAAPDGYLSVSVPHQRVAGWYSPFLVGEGAVALTVNRQGQVLTSSAPLDEADAALPPDRAALGLEATGPNHFTAERADGTPMHYSVVPIEEGTLYAVGARPVRTAGIGGTFGFFASPVFLAVFMWLASLVLVTFTVERQVVGPVRVLAARMRRFARDRELPPPPRPKLPRELQIIGTEFRGMAERLLQDEADLFNAMHEKDVLLKEVHHRVKNNLQLISSMINMQERRAEQPETVAVLDHISRRVSSMATVHRMLYQADALSRVRAEELLARVTAPLAQLAPARCDGKRLDVRSSFAPVLLYPDQALPLALLTVEAVTNALKYAGDAGAGPWVRIALEQGEGQTVALTIENSVAADARTVTGTSLGTRLIQSFARQLGGAPEITVAEGVYRLCLEFETMPFDATDTPGTDWDGSPEPGGGAATGRQAAE